MSLVKKILNASSSDHIVVEMEKLLPATEPSAEWPRWSKPCIYRVPLWLKKITNDGNDAAAEEVYRPRLVSLGPFHHHDPHLRPMEEHKRRAVLHIVKRTGKPLREFFAAIEEVANELMDAYHGLNEEWRGEGNKARFVQVMVVDGCFLLEILKGVASKTAPHDYAYNDPVFSYSGILSKWLCIRSDMLMIENQLPMLALYRLEAVWRGRRRGTISMAQSAKDVNEWVLNFLMQAGKVPKGIDNLFLHPLDIYHRLLCGLHPTPLVLPVDDYSSTMPAAVEMRAAGIHFQKSEVTRFTDISFENGVLRLPALSIHDGTKQVFLNLMAFERLHGDTGTVATDYMIFMDNIIDSERDVAILRSKGIIKNLLSSDKDASNLYNILSRGAVMNPYSKLHEVRRDVNAHCKTSWKRWIAFLRHDYLKSPWGIISLVAAVILLIATLLQTVYTVWAFYVPSS